MIDIALLAFFLGVGSYTVLLVWRKIPLLLQVPQQLIEESFVTRPSHLKKFLEPALNFFRSGRYREIYYAVLVRALHLVRLWLLRLERIVFRMLESLQSRGRHLSETEERYWGELKQWKQDVKQNGNHIPHAVFTPLQPGHPAIHQSREEKKEQKADLKLRTLGRVVTGFNPEVPPDAVSKSDTENQEPA